MARIGVVAALLACALFVVGGTHRSASARPVQHTCGLTDREFLDDYGTQLGLVDAYGDDFVHGSAKAGDVVGAAQDAAATVRRSRPLDPSLRSARKYARAMFLQYAVAVRARAAGRSAAREMYLAQSTGARLDEVLREAQPGLAAKGCDVSAVLE